MIQKHFSRLKKLIFQKNSSPERVAKSIALGVGVGFSPFLGIQSYIPIILGPLIGASPLIAIAFIWIVNNPLTMIPIAALDYKMGVVVFERWLSWDMGAYNPALLTRFGNWINSFETTQKLVHYLGAEQFQLLTFLAGGTLLAIVVGFVAYVCALWAIRRARKL